MEVTTDRRTHQFGNTDFPGKHERFQYYRDSFPDEFTSYYKFTIVRNPFDRFVSEWYWATKVVKTQSCDFVEFVLNYPKSWTYASLFSLRGYTIRESVAQFDYVGRFEKLNETYRHLCDRLGLDCTSIPRTNVTAHDNYRKYYDASTVSAVSELYRKDIELFGYSF